MLTLVHNIEKGHNYYVHKIVKIVSHIMGKYLTFDENV